MRRFAFALLPCAVLATLWACGNDDATSPDALPDAAAEAEPFDAGPADAHGSETLPALDEVLDPSFASKGVLVGRGERDIENGIAIARQNDGKFVVAVWNESHYQVELLRFTTSGTLDASFGTEGKVIAWSADGHVAGGLAIRSDGKILALAQGSLGVPSVVYRFDTTGKLDPAFGVAGAAVVPGLYQGFALQGDGKIVLAGQSQTPAGWEFAVTRLEESGAPDAAFGKKLTRFGAGADSDTALAQRVAVQGDGKIVVAGEHRASGKPASIAVARYNASGSLDNGFNGSGRVLYSANGDGGVASTQGASLLLASDGKILVGGTYDNQMIVTRFTSGGALDESFGDQGACKPVLGGPPKVVVSLAPGPNGTVYAGLARQTADALVVRITNEGDLDPAFSGGNVSVPAVMTFGGIAAFGDGKVIVTGGKNNDTVLLRRNADGSNDGAFGATVNMGASREIATALAVRPDGKVAVVGSLPADGFALVSAAGAVETVAANVLPEPPVAVAADAQNRVVVVSGSSNFTVTRRTAAGARDAAFGTTTVAFSDLATPSAVVVEPNGRIVITGGTFSPKRFALARLDAAGKEDPSFDDNGRVSFGSAESTAFALAVKDGKPVAVGYAVSGSRHDIAVARLLESGTVDPAFAGGFVTTNATDAAYEYGRAVAIANDGKILVAGNVASVSSPSGDAHFGGTSKVIVLRYLANGTLDPAFAVQGKAILEPLGSEAYAHGIAIADDGRILVAGRRYATSREEAFVARLTRDGSLISSEVLPNGNASSFRALALQPDGKLLAAGHVHASATGDDWALVRLLR